MKPLQGNLDFFLIRASRGPFRLKHKTQGPSHIHIPKDKESACNEGDLGSIPGLRRCPGEESGNPFQYACLGNPMERQRSLVSYSP